MSTAGCTARRRAARRHLLDAAGTSILEALVAAAVVITIAAGVAHLLVWSRRATWSAGVRSTAVVLATAKLEQLRALDWFTDAAGVPVSDTSTNLAREPHTPDGTGLRPSPPGTLAQNTPGFVDFVGLDGAWRGTGRDAPPGAVFVRRWGIAPYPDDPAGTLVLTVVTFHLGAGRAFPASAAGAVRVQTLRTRLAP